MGSHRAFIILSCMCLTNPPTLHIKSQKYFIFNVHGGLGEGSKAHINLQDCTGIMTVIRLLVGNQSLYVAVLRPPEGCGFSVPKGFHTVAQYQFLVDCGPIPCHAWYKIISW